MRTERGSLTFIRSHSDREEWPHDRSIDGLLRMTATREDNRVRGRLTTGINQYQQLRSLSSRFTFCVSSVRIK